jgi:hypothetical protein
MCCRQRGCGFSTGVGLSSNCGESQVWPASGRWTNDLQIVTCNRELRIGCQPVNLAIGYCISGVCVGRNKKEALFLVSCDESVQPLIFTPHNKIVTRPKRAYPTIQSSTPPPPEAVMVSSVMRLVEATSQRTPLQVIQVILWRRLGNEGMWCSLEAVHLRGAGRTLED